MPRPPGGPLTEAQRQLASDNYWLVCWVIKRFPNRFKGVDRDDIKAICEDALITAVRRWEPTRGKFSTCYVWAVIGRLSTYHRLNRPKGYRLKDRQAPYPRVESFDQLVMAQTLDDPADAAASRRLEMAELSDLLSVAMQGLTTRGKAVVQARFQDGKSLADIGRDFGFTRERARQILDESLGEIRSRIGVQV